MATTKRDYYEVLGCEKTADGKVLKSAYRKLAMEFHLTATLITLRQNPNSKKLSKLIPSCQTTKNDLLMTAWATVPLVKAAAGEAKGGFHDVGEYFSQFLAVKAAAWICWRRWTKAVFARRRPTLRNGN